MIEHVLGLDRADMWDMGGLFGVLKGQLFHNIIENLLPVKEIKDCKVPYGATAYDILRFRTNCITDGSLATAMRASCTFPGLFQPVLINNWPHIDGGVFDQDGLMALPGVPKSNLIVNILCDISQFKTEVVSKYPDAYVIIYILSIANVIIMISSNSLSLYCRF